LLEQSALDSELPGQVLKLADQLYGQLDTTTGDFEERLLDQELWASVDLLQSIGIKNHQLLEDVVVSINAGASTEELKTRIRDGRAAIGDWLFIRFKNIAAQESPNEEAVRAFDQYLDQLQLACKTFAVAPITVEQHEALFVRMGDDSPLHALNKWAKRQLRRMFHLRFSRRFSPHELTCSILLVDLPKRLLRIANMVGEAEFFLLRRVKALYEELDITYNAFLAHLDEVNVEGGDVGGLVHSTEKVRDELDESFRLVGGEVMKYYEEIRVALRGEVKRTGETWLREASRAGTLGWSGHSQDTNDGVVRVARRELRGLLGNWGRYLVGFTGANTMELEVARLQNSLRHAIDETVLGVNRRLWQQLREQCDGVEGKMGETTAVLRRYDAADVKGEDVRIVVDRCRSELLDFLSNRVKKRLDSISYSGEISQLIDLLSERFRRLVDSSVESFQIVELEDLPMQEGVVPRDAQLKTAPMRAVVRTYLERDLTHRLGDINRAMLDQVETFSRAVDQLWQTVNFSLGNVAVELREAGKEPHELLVVALSRLEKAEENFGAEMRRVREANSAVEDKIIAEVAGIARKLRQMILEETVVEMRRQIGRSKKKLPRERASSSGPEVAVANEIVAAVKVENKKGDEPFRGRAEILGYEAILGLEERVDKTVPFAYRRLFRTTPLEVSEFLQGRSDALGAIETAARRWATGSFSAVALVGEQGSGKTSLVNCAMQQKLAGIPIVRHRIDATLLDPQVFTELLNKLLDSSATSQEALQEEVASSNTRRIIILEDLHQLYLRAEGGLDLIRRLLEFIDATGGQLLWIITIDQYAWQYLDHAISLSRHFAFLIETGRLSRSELEGAIMARHQATGYQLRFVSSDGDQQDHLRSDFFDALSNACAGNVFAAIYYWLQSVCAVEGNTVEIAPLEELELQFLEEMSIEGMLSLGMIIQHGSLSAEHYSRIFHIPIVEGRARLAHLERMGLLQVRVEGGRGEYSVGPLLYHPVVLELERRNIVR